MTFPPIGPSIMLYVFGIINSWSRLPLFSPTNPTADPSKLRWVEMRAERAKGLNDYVNDATSYVRNRHLLRLDVCDGLRTSLAAQVLTFEWTVNDVQNDKLATIVGGTHCSQMVQVEMEGFYTASVQVFSPGASFPLFVSKLKQPLRVMDYWIAAVGDSFASGEGNPSTPLHTLNNFTIQPAEWLHEGCHRSSRSWPYKVYQKLVGLTSKHQSIIHFTYLACSGASVEQGLLDPSPETGQSPSQLSAIQKISSLRGRGPDLLLMSIGGNDIGYSHVLDQLLQGGRQSKRLFSPSTLQMRFFYGSIQMSRLARYLREEIKPKQVLLPWYFDMSKNEKGQVASDCEDLRGISVDNLSKAENLILKRLNRLISDTGRKFDWKVVGEEVSELFSTRGMCSKKSLIRSREDSLGIQGDFLGAFHPTEEAHTKIADLAFGRLDFRSLVGGVSQH